MYSSVGQNIKSSAVSDVRCSMSGVRCSTHFCVCMHALSCWGQPRNYCLSNGVHSSIGENIKSSAVSDVWCLMSDTFVCAWCALSRSQIFTDFDEIYHRRLEPDRKNPFENPLRVFPIFTPFYPKLAPT